MNMSPFALEASGPPVSCDFPRCTLEAFHEGEHEFGSREIEWTYDRHCVVCGVPFTVLGAEKSQIFDTCGSEECLLHYARRHAPNLEVMCTCPQRPYPHELSVHELIRSEWWAHKRNLSWPWSLMASVREEPSTERMRA